MARKPETIFKEKVVRFLKKLPKTYFVVNDHRSVRGVPDIFICCNSVFVAIELKKDYAATRRTSPRIKLQHWTLEEIAKCGGYGWMVYPENWSHTQELLVDLAEGKYYDHIDIRTNTQQRLCDGIEKAIKPRRVYPKSRSPRRKASIADSEV